MIRNDLLGRLCKDLVRRKRLLRVPGPAVYKPITFVASLLRVSWLLRRIDPEDMSAGLQL